MPAESGSLRIGGARGPVRYLRLKQALVLLLGLALAALMLLLGLWQANVAKEHGREEIERRASAAAVPLNGQIEPRTMQEHYGTQVRLQGSYLPKEQAVVTGKQFRIVTAFRLDSGQTIAVVRGSVPSPTITSFPDAPSGHVSISGLALPSEQVSRDDRSPMQDLHLPHLNAVDLGVLAQQWSGPMVNGFITLDADGARANKLSQATATLPDGSGSAQNAGYALQWWVFAAFAITMSIIWIVVLGRRNRQAAPQA